MKAAIFERDFKFSRPSYKSVPITHDNNIIDGKEAAFWHIIQKEDFQASGRVPDLRRCERIPWPRPMIEHSNDAAISVWKNIRHRQARILIWLEQLNYLVVLAKMPKEIVLVTAYCTDYKRKCDQLRKERDEYRRKMQKPPC